MIQTDVTVIGGGAAGLVAGISAASCGAGTIIVEHMDRVGKKLLATGNGKCNYTNALQGISYYRGENPAFVLPVFEQFGLAETLAFFEELGIYPKERTGYYYPASGPASSVLDVLRMEADYRKVDIYTSCELQSVEKTGRGFRIRLEKDEILTKTILFATGLLASPKTGSDGTAFQHIEKLGHHFIDIVPALVQLKGKQAFFKELAGIRAEMCMELYVDDARICSECGELQLTEYGISGIPVFQLSRFAVRALRQNRRVCARINFAPNMDEAVLSALLEKRFGENARGKSASEALIGLFNRKLSAVLLKESGIGLHAQAGTVEKKQLGTLCGTIRNFRVDLVGSKGFEAAQVCAGGVDTAEIDSRTLESKLVRGVYFAGEVIDIDGTCGGYNLQWAWSSGYVAGRHAGAKALEIKAGERTL